MLRQHLDFGFVQRLVVAEPCHCAGGRGSRHASMQQKCQDGVAQRTEMVPRIFIDEDGYFFGRALLEHARLLPCLLSISRKMADEFSATTCGNSRPAGVRRERPHKEDRKSTR